jgi:hypothetical protein
MTDQTRYPSQRGNPSSQARSGSDTRFSRRAEDPLAELARLIGQDDPFAETDSTPRAAPSRSQATPVARRSANGNGAAPAAYPRAERRDDYYANDDYEQPADEYDRTPEPAYGRAHQDAAGYEVEPRRLPAKQYNGRAYSYGGMPARAEPPARPARPAPQPEYEEEYDDPRYAPAHGQDSHAEARGHEEDYQYDNGSYEGQDYASEYEQDYAAEDYPEEYAEPARNKRRWMLLGVMSLIGLVVLGITGIYGYRAIFKKHTAGNPPTIRSAETPAKVAPTAAQAKPEGAKQNYDRIGETPPVGGERVVSREEQPAIPSSSNARTVTTTAVGAQTGNSVSAFAAPSQTPALTPPPSTVNHGNGEPRRVRTLTVRSDGTIVDPRHGQAAPARGGAPLALNANAQDTADEPTHAARGATHQAFAAPARTTNYAPAGSYVVQVSSQKSEQDAQTAWRQLQSKYTNVLGNAQVSFKRVDLGDRGTFYRAMVGPFANRDQAYEMCQNLKTAGGECVVQRN